MHLAQPVLEFHLGLVFENLAGFVNRGEEAMLLVPVPALDELNACVVSGFSARRDSGFA